jgi:hypothetical protein
VLRRYELEPDGSVPTAEAGEALHALLSVAQEPGERTLERAPVRVYQQEWFPEDTDSITGGEHGAWALDLFARVSRGLAPRERDYLNRVASHPAHAEFRRVALADSVDIIGARYALPFPDTATPFILPIPQFRGVRDAANAHIALAALELSQGSQSRAETTLRELVSVGFALIDEGPDIIDGMIGTRLVDAGGEALERLYSATGRTLEAENLMWVRTGMEQALDRAAATRAASYSEDVLMMMPAAVLNETVLRGLRWEYLLTFATLAPCVNLNKVVFTAGEDFEQWLSEARQALVRRPSDEVMFEFLQQGWFRGARAYDAPFWIKAALRVTFGSSLGGSCAAQVGGLDMVAIVQ